MNYRRTLPAVQMGVVIFTELHQKKLAATGENGEDTIAYHCRCTTRSLPEQIGDPPVGACPLWHPMK